MGFTIPSPTSPAEQARALMARKESAEAEIENQLTILRANNSTLRSPLIDADGFPRDDIDIYAVRNARIRIIELRNDIEALVAAIGKALEGVYDPSLAQVTSEHTSEEPTAAQGSLKPFAKVNGVAPGSPAAEAGLQREDLILKFGHLTAASFLSASSLQPLAELVNGSENRSLSLKIQRSSDQTVFLSLIPRNGWGGRGMLGCHIVPYSPS